MSSSSGLNTRGGRGSFRGVHSSRGGRGRGQGQGDGEGHGGGSQSSRGGRGRGRGEGDGEGRGRGRGRGRGGWLTDEQKAQIVVVQRPATIQVASEGTDDVILATSADEQLQHVASFILRKKDFTNFHTQSQIRKFVNSCLINLSNHHKVDTSGILVSLASVSGRARLTEIMEKHMGVDVGGDKSILSFQFVVLPLVGVLTRESVCQSIMTCESGAIYATVYLNRQSFLENGVMRCMDELLDRGSLRDLSLAGRRLPREDPSVCQVSSLQHAMLAITRLIYQLIRRNRDARFEMADVVRRLRTQQEKCLKVGTDSPESRFIKEVLTREVKRLEYIVDDAQETIIQPTDPSGGLESNLLRRMRGPNRVHLAMIYDPPGDLSPSGPRHDNDFLSIRAIQVLPTQKEITSSRAPFLPCNGVPDAPHFLAPGWKRQLDIHFRLYREDMLNPLKKGVMGFLSALKATDKGKEEVLLRPKDLRKLLGDNVSLNVYGNVEFKRMDTTKQLAGSIQISFDQPSQLQGKNQTRRAEFWQRSKSRLMQGALVCIARRSTHEECDEGKDVEMILGVVLRRDVDVLAWNDAVAHIHISLTDPRMYLVMLNSVTHAGGEPWFLVESTGGFFESYRPVLKVLQNCEPATMPFGKYLAPTKEETEARSENGCEVDPPLYSRAPGFAFDLSVLLKGQQFRLDVTDRSSAAGAVDILQKHSTLDNTQAEALVETLCREVALISGPPGTGKTKIGIDLMRVLLDNGAKMRCGPILCICYTNHALDQFLEHILDEGITKIVRVGARSKSERLQNYTLESLMKSSTTSFGVKQALKTAFEGLDEIRVKIEILEKSLRSDIPEWEYIGPCLMMNSPDQYNQFANWKRSVRDEEIESEANSEYHDGYTDEAFLDGFFEDDAPSNSLDDDDSSSDITDDDGGSSDVNDEDDDSSDVNDQDSHSDEGKFTEVEVKGRSSTNNDPFTRWARALDIKELMESNKKAQNRWEKRDRKSSHNIYNAYYRRLKQEPILRHIPEMDRPLLLLNGNVWEMSIQERGRLLESWKPEIQTFMMDKMELLLNKMESFTQAKNAAFDESRRSILRSSLVIGMTTSGAAKLQTMISAVAPKIIICEEAGEVLESHILSALSESTQHLILIGDHQQLRPQIETYTLSSDSTVGKNHNLDQSLFERLVTAESMPLSHLTIQRRMRPEISSLIRSTLYPNLEDGERVRQYPPVGGMGANLYFMNHAHPEDSKDQYGVQSFANTFEVKMVEALARYLIKNGYDKPGDIAVLTPYLGQLSKLRDCLRNSFILVVDERDQEQLDLKEEEKEQDGMISKVNEQVGVKKLDLQNHLTLRTIDNYQGEEAKIVIISLVRSDVKSDGSLSASSTIGFLKSPNRTNVLLSRAQHGMYIIGNAGLMGKEKHGIWPTVIEELRDFGRIGDGIPIMCKNHPEMQNIVDSPDKLNVVSPNGGCMNACGHNMPCGHVCPLTCHPDDENHLMSSLAAMSMSIQHATKPRIRPWSFAEFVSHESSRPASMNASSSAI
ncbi:hypothetical protein BGZ58_004342 [Dissophora ornata]|nr:hypothetical protein BGZ58_004342 [Dissophora ornata]